MLQSSECLSSGMSLSAFPHFGHMKVKQMTAEAIQLTARESSSLAEELTDIINPSQESTAANSAAPATTTAAAPISLAAAAPNASRRRPK